jgi:putative ABC transport system ATP-binding protein
MIRARGLMKTYVVGDETVRALAGVDLDIAAGELVAITGSSGSGKSTLMHVLGLLDRPDAGSYHLDGRAVAALGGDALSAERGQRIGFVFQSFHLLPRLDVVENVALPLRYARDPKARVKAEAALVRVGLGDRLAHKPTQLSGGQRQRVAIARALVINPAILLADEPTGNLDSHTGQEVLALFDTLHQEGRTILIVTHDPAVAARCPRQIHLVDGRVATDHRVDPARTG